VTATVDEVFSALASPARRELLRLLLDGPRTVSSLAARFDMARPSVSEHLKILREAGLVTETRHGRERHYRLEPAPLMQLSDWLHPYERFWRAKMAGLRRVLDEQAQRPAPHDHTDQAVHQAIDQAEEAEEADRR
jgi:DNA-binding transcriptional ArsR family regulator